MKLTWRIIIRISLLMVIVLSIWAVLFHGAVMDEVNDEIDDSLELLSENLIRRVLHGEELPSVNNGTNNTYFIDSVTAEYASETPKIRYSNEIMHIADKNDDEPSRVRRTIFMDEQNAYHMLTVATPTVETEELMEAIANWIVLLYCSLLVLIIVICLWVLSRSMRPLYRLLRWLDNTDISHGVEPIDNPTDVNEFVRLNDAIFRSAKRSEQLYTQQKQFTGNASHEIQTPLAVCQSRLEMLANTDLSEEQLLEVIKTQNTLEYISRLNKELLLLTKIDGGQFTDIAEIDMKKLAEKSAEDFGMIFQYRQISLSMDCTGAPTISMNTTLASVLITNLIRNAYVHNHPHGKIVISIDDTELKVSNTGDTTPLDASQIFERFYQGQKHEGSTGLGLALVRAVCGLYGFALQYYYVDGYHNFSIKFH